MMLSQRKCHSMASLLSVLVTYYFFGGMVEAHDKTSDNKAQEQIVAPRDLKKHHGHPRVRNLQTREPRPTRPPAPSPSPADPADVIASTSVETLLDGVAVSGLSALLFESLEFVFETPLFAGDSIMCRLFPEDPNNQIGDADVIILFGGTNADGGDIGCDTGISGNFDSCVASVASGAEVAFVEVFAFEAFAEVSLECFLNDVNNVINNGALVTGISLPNAGTFFYFRLSPQLSAGDEVTCTTDKIDAILSLKLGMFTDLASSDFDCESSFDGTNHVCSVVATSDVDLFGAIYAQTDNVNDVTLQCCINGDCSTPAPTPSPTLPPVCSSVVRTGFEKFMGRFGVNFDNAEAEP